MPGGRVGGGGRSSGGGRVGGGRSGGGGRSSGGSRGGSFGGSRGGSFGSSRGGAYYGGYRTTSYRGGGGGYRRGGGTGCLGRAMATTILIFVIILVLALAFSGGIGSGGGFSSGGVAKSTVQREPLASRYVNRTAYYEDTAGWIGSSSVLESGMKHFYQETGVQPFLYVTETIDGDYDPATSTMNAYAEALYDSLFTDEGHLLVIFYGDDQYWYTVGQMANTVFDSEAQGIFEDYINAYASDYMSGMSLESFLSTVFEKTADRIMQVTPSVWPYVAGGAVALVIVIVLFQWWKRAKAQKNKEAEHAERVLNTDINDLAEDPTLADLEKKYSRSSDTSAEPKPPSSRSSRKVETFETADRGYTDPALKDLEDRYK